MLPVVLVHQNQRHLQEGRMEGGRESRELKRGRGAEKGRELRDRSRYSIKVHVLILNMAETKVLYTLCLPCTQMAT